MVDALLVTVLLLNFFLLGTSRLRAVVHGSAAQGIVLGGLALVSHEHVGLQSLLMALGAVVIKGAVIPLLLLRALRDASIRREVEPLVGYIPSLLLGAVGTGGAVLFARTLPLAPNEVHSLLIPAAFATVLTGFLLLVTRRKAITQVVGYLVLENGIFLMGLTLVEAIPLLVEVGVLLDLFVAVLVMGIIIEHIHREHASLDTVRLSTLRE